MTFPPTLPTGCLVARDRGPGAGADLPARLPRDAVQRVRREGRLEQIDARLDEIQARSGARPAPAEADRQAQPPIPPAAERPPIPVPEPRRRAEPRLDWPR